MHYKNNVRMNQYHDMLKNGNSIFRKIRVKIEIAIAASAPPSPAISPQVSMAMRLQALLDAAKAKSPARPARLSDDVWARMTPREQRHHTEYANKGVRSGH